VKVPFQILKLIFGAPSYLHSRSNGYWSFKLSR